MKRTVFFKIFIGYLVITCLLASVVFYSVFTIMRHYHIKTLTGDLEKLGKTLIVQFLPYLEKQRHADLDSFVKQLGADIETRITVIDARGVVLADSDRDPLKMENHKTRPEILQALAETVGSSIRYSQTVKESMLYVALPVKQNDAVSHVVRVSLFLVDINLILHDLRDGILKLSLIMVGIALLISFVFSRRLTEPVRKLSDASRRVASGDFDVRVFLKTKDELYDFADSFNYMTEKIRSLFDEVSLQKEELKNIISSMHEGLMVVDRNDHVVLFNNSFKELTGAETAKGVFYWEVLRDPQFGTILKRVRSEHRDIIEEVPLDGQTFLCSASIIEPKGEIIIILLDVSEIKNVERMKKDFVVNVSHELRTPLTAIKGFIETMHEEVQDESHKRYLDIIKRHTDRLINIVKDLMLLSSLEKVQTLEKEEVYLKGLIEQTRKIYDQRLKEKNLTLTVETDNERLPVSADPFKLEQMFINLIDNSIKYTEQGGIFVSITHNTKDVTIVIEDTGIGITRDHLPKLFERFYVVDKSRSRKVGGTGLGLSIVKHIVLLHNGTIEVDSTPGSGTRFTIHLPLANGG